ncbi:MAG: hypothetical protein OHK0011_12730 [Turneriella sp.]
MVWLRSPQVRVLTRIRSSLLAVMLLPIFTACLGRATPPDQVKLTQAQNEVLGKFARQVGERELNILLNDPNDTTLPGIPIGDLLYILSRVNEDKLIRLVKGITATTTLELILTIKRLACTRYEAIFPGNGFDARSVASLNQCTWQHFHLPNLMVQLLNGTNDQGLQTLIDTVKHSYPTLTCASSGGNLAANQPLCPASTMVTTQPGTTAATDTFNTQPYKVTIDHYSYLMKLAYIVVGFDTPSASDPNLSSPGLVGPTKLYNLLNLTLDGRDMAYLLDSFDSNTVNLSRETPATYCPGAGTTTSNCVYIDTTVPTAPVYYTYHAAGNLWLDICPVLRIDYSCDPAVLGYQLQGLRNLLSVMESVTDTSKMGTLLNGRRTTRNDTAQDTAQIRYFTDRLRPVIEHRADAACVFPGTALEQTMQDFRTPHGGSGAWNAKLAEIINRVTNVDRMMDLIYNVDDGFTINHTIGNACPNRGIDNLMVLLNNINNVDPHNAPNTTNNEVMTAAYLIDNVTLFPTDADPRRRNKVKYLVEYIGSTLDVLQLACYTAVADHVDGVAPADATPDTCDNRGLINQVADGSKVDGSVTDLTAAGRKLANLADQINEIEDMRFLVRKVPMGYMTQIINGLQIASTVNVANLVNQIQGQDCWNEQGGVIAGSTFNYGLGYATSVSNPGALNAYTGNFVVNPLPGGSANALVKAIVETDATNHPTFVGRVRAFVVTGSGTNYAAGTYNDGGGAAMAYTAGQCYYNPPTAYRGFPTLTATGATGLGKLVNVINHITGSPDTIVTLVNGVTDGAKLGILINGSSRSSNLVGVMNAVVDASRSNNATIADLIDLLKGLSREDVYKLVHLLENLGDAREVDAQVTLPAVDHDMVAQLMAPYAPSAISTSSGIGNAALAEFIALLRYDGGNGLTGSGTLNIAGGGGTGATATYARTDTGQISAIELTSYGNNCSAEPAVTISGGGGSGAAATAILDAAAQQILRIRLDNPGAGYTTAPTVSFGAGCATAPTAAARLHRVGAITITSPGSGYTDNPTTCSAAAVGLTCQVSGALNTLANFSGGSGYTTGDICPIMGAGGSGATCTVTESGGALTGCSAIGGGGGINYGDGRIVKIGGRAEAVATVSGGVIGSVVVTNSGCGYTATPAVHFVGCASQPTTVTVTMSGGATGRVTGITVSADSSGCPVGAKVVIGENPFVAFADGASAIVDSLTNGRLTFVSVSEPAVNAAQLIQLIDRDATGITSGTRGFSITYNSTTPNISAREALVRLLHHGVTIPAGSPKGYFSENFGLGSVVDVVSDGVADNQKSGVALGGAGVWTNAYAVNLPGLGVTHIANAILNNLSGVTATQTLINMLNSNGTDLTDLSILLGCGDRSTYTNTVVTPFTWQQLCTQLGPGLW